MTRKHFQALANALRKCRPDFDRPRYGCEFDPNFSLRCDIWAKWEEMVSEVASVCASSNSNFRRSTFLEACGSDKC